MMKHLVTLIVLLTVLPLTAWASPFDGWTLAEIKAESRFQPINEIGCGYMLGYTSADETSTPEPSAARDTWIGFIRLDGDKVVVFNRRGDGLTILDWEQASVNGPDVPLWLDLDAIHEVMLTNYEAFRILSELCDTCEEKCG